MAPISLALVKIEGDAKANDDADTDAITPRKPLNARLDRNIEPPFSANLNSSSDSLLTFAHCSCSRSVLSFLIRDNLGVGTGTFFY
jgi:hypothetical protein